MVEIINCVSAEDKSTPDSFTTLFNCSTISDSKRVKPSMIFTSDKPTCICHSVEYFSPHSPACIAESVSFLLPKHVLIDEAPRYIFFSRTLFIFSFCKSLLSVLVLSHLLFFPLQDLHCLRNVPYHLSDTFYYCHLQVL